MPTASRLAVVPVNDNPAFTGLTLAAAAATAVVLGYVGKQWQRGMREVQSCDKERCIDSGTAIEAMKEHLRKEHPYHHIPSATFTTKTGPLHGWYVSADWGHEHITYLIDRWGGIKHKVGFRVEEAADDEEVSV